jgi:CRISPR-associated protein Cst1
VFRYTGHPIADVGVATICAFSEKNDPAELTCEDLANAAGFLAREYFSGKLLSYLSCVFPNSAYVNPTTGAEKKESYKREILYGFENAPRLDANGLKCVFSGEPASRIVNRQHVPLLTGEGVLNFFPAGADGLPISADYLLAIQMFPLGARRCFGKALAVHCPDDPKLTLEFARHFLEYNRALMLLAQKTGEKYEDAKWPRTIVIDQLLKITARDHSNTDAPRPSITVYHLSNYGRNADIGIYELPSESLSFVGKAIRATTAQAWDKIVARAWELPIEKKKGKSNNNSEANSTNTSGVGVNRNFLYEDLFTLPDYAPRFVRTYFLRRPWRAIQQTRDPRTKYQVARELDLISWPLTYLFLREVVGMERCRIEAIKSLAGRIADHIQNTDERFFGPFYRVMRYENFRNLLIQACNHRVKRGLTPLIGLEEFLTVFEEAEGFPSADWRLARDILLIGVIDTLYSRHFFEAHPESLPEDEETAEEEQISGEGA